MKSGAGRWVAETDEDAARGLAGCKGDAGGDDDAAGCAGPITGCDGGGEITGPAGYSDGTG